MYEENENKIDWGNIIKRVVMIIGAILIILGIVTAVSKCAKKDIVEPPKEKEVDLTNQLNQLEAATLKYLTKDNLPVELNASKTIRLKILINKEILTDITDENNNKCDTNESYAEVTRLENSYAVKLSLTCGKNKDYRIIYVGCFEDCNGGICKGTENSIGGVCNEIVDKEPDKKPVNNNNNNTSSINNNNKPNTSTPSKPNNSNSGSNNSNNNNNNSNTNNNNNQTNNKPKEIMYEYKRCSTSCKEGTLNSRTNKCEFEIRNPFSTKVSFTNSSLANKKNPAIGYSFISYANDLYNYIMYECTDSYIFNYDTKKCTRNSIDPIKSCETTWSYSTSLPGWERTGNTK